MITESQFRSIKALSESKSYREAAEKRGISAGSIKAHVYTIMRRFKLWDEFFDRYPKEPNQNINTVELALFLKEKFSEYDIDQDILAKIKAAEDTIKVLKLQMKMTDKTIDRLRTEITQYKKQIVMSRV